MPFTITATDGLARCGTFLTRHAQLATPAPLIYTRRGGALYLTPDLLARLRGGTGSDGGNGDNGATTATATTPNPTTCVLGLVTTQFLDQPAPELLAAVANAPARGTDKNNNDAAAAVSSSTGGAGVAWAGLQGWPAFALNRDPLLFEYGPPAGARPATNNGPHVAVASGHTLADLRAWMAAVRAMSPDCFVGLADELPCCSGGGEREGDGGNGDGDGNGTATDTTTTSPLESSYEELVRAVVEAEEEKDARRRGKGGGLNGAAGADNEPDAQGRVAPPPLPPLPPKAPTKPPRLAFPPGVDARVARAVERTAWWVDRCMAELESGDVAAAEAGAGAGAGAGAAEAARAEQDRGVPVPFERQNGGGGAAAAAATSTASTTTTPPTPPTPPPLQFFAPVVGCDSPAARLVSAREAARRDGPRVAGYALCGFGTGEKPGDRQPLLRAALTPLPRNKPRLLSALLDQGPLEVLDAVALGVDLFDCAWPTASTAAGYALSFPITPEEEGLYEDDADEEEEEKGGDGTSAAAATAEAPWAAAALATAPVTSAEAAAASTAAEAAGGPTRGRRLPDGARLNLWAPGFRLDRRPLAKGCSCQACAPPATLALNHPPPSRAYIHHLLAVEEMVAEVLLDAHNEHHWLRFFAQIRKEVEKGRLAEYRAWLEGWLAKRRYAGGEAPPAGRVGFGRAAAGNGATTTTATCTPEDD